MIDGNIEVVILDVSGETVKVGIRAPREISIYRQELYEAIRDENIKAARSGRGIPEKLKQFVTEEDNGSEKG
jgi:carbon storage regulator